MLCCLHFCLFFFFFKQKTAYEMRISDWSSDVCSSDLEAAAERSSGSLRVTARLPRPINRRSYNDQPVLIFVLLGAQILDDLLFRYTSHQGRTLILRPPWRGRPGGVSVGPRDNRCRGPRS